MDKISVIVPVYNAERYLSQCIESLIKQTHEDVEIILINDGSIDGSLKICEKYEKNDNRIKVHSIKNSGVSTARNLGISVATGEYITFVDSDDWAEPNMLEFALKKIKESNSDIVIWSYFKNYLDDELLLSLLPGGDQTFEDNKDILYLKSIYALYGEGEITESVSSGTVWCKLYRKKLITENKLEFNPMLIRAQDTVFSINVFEKAKKISYYDKSLYHYRINNSSTCSGTRLILDTKKPFNKLLEEFKAFTRKYDNHNYDEALNARTIQVLMWHLKHNYFHSGNRKNIFQKRKEILSLINTEPYKSALFNINNSLLPKKERLMANLFRYKLILIFYFIYVLYNKKEQSKSRRYD